MIKIKDLSVKYRRGQVPILKNINSEFVKRCLILGPNGSGKTTLFKAIAGLTNFSGEILIDGINIENIYGKPNILAVNLIEVYEILAVSVYDIIYMYSDITEGDVEVAFKILDDLGIERSFLKRRKLWELSAGQKKAVSTALALSSGASHVLLDEPFEQLDPARKSKLISYLKNYKGIILLNTHETWLLSTLKGWDANLMFDGKLYGPLSSDELLKSSLIIGETPDTLISVEISGKKISIVKGDVGKPLTDIITLDRIYELAISGL